MMTINSEIIWLRYQKDIKRFIMSKIKDKDLTNDIMQDVFIKLHSKISTLKNQEKVKTWLFQITRNTINDHFRKQKFSVDILKTDIPEETERKSLNKQFLNCVHPLINKLPGKYREVLTKVELQNCSQLKLARELNISYSALKSRVQRGREILKNYFKECCNISADKYGNIISSEKRHKCSMC